MKVSSFWLGGCRPRFSFVIPQPLTDTQELSKWFACLSLRERLWHTAPFTNHNDPSNRRTPSRELRFQLQGMFKRTAVGRLWKFRTLLRLVPVSAPSSAPSPQLKPRHPPVNVCGTNFVREMARRTDGKHVIHDGTVLLPSLTRFAACIKDVDLREFMFWAW